MEETAEIGIFGGTGIYDSGLLKDSKEITIFSPANTKSGYYAQFGWGDYVDSENNEGNLPRLLLYCYGHLSDSWQWPASRAIPLISSHKTLRLS